MGVVAFAMATQRISLAKVGGAAADEIARQFQQWEQTRLHDEFPATIQFALDEFAEVLRTHSSELPIVYFSEWIDTWSMGDLIPSLGDERAVMIHGRRYEACCHRPPILLKSTTIAGEPTQESEWLKCRLEEAKDAWHELVPNWVIIVMREPLGGLVEDDELVRSLQKIPDWLIGARRTDNSPFTPESEKRNP
jgi:hypothetical protein